MSKNIKILVVGAGIAGLAICYWLRRFGFYPVLIEKFASIRKGGQALDIRGIATQIARKMGIYEHIYDRRTRIECGRFVDTTGKVLHEEQGEKFGFRQDDEVEILRDDFYFDAITQVKMNSWTKGRIALVGDAGYCPSPLSGQGNNSAFVGAYILAGELTAANGNYLQAFARYNSLLHSFVGVNQEFGVWVSKSFLVDDEISKEIAEERSRKILDMIKSVSNAITLPQYE